MSINIKQAEIQKKYRERKKALDPDFLKQQALKKKIYRDKKKAEMVVGDNIIAKNDLQTIFNSIKTRKDKPLSKISIINYIAKLNKLSQLVVGHDYTDYNFLTNPDNVINIIKKSNLQSKKDYITPIIKILQHYGVSEDLIKQYRTNLGEHKEVEDNKRGDNLLQKEKDRENAMSLDDINKKYNEYSIYDGNKINPNKLIYKLIVAFYFKNNLIPRNDIPLMKLANINKKDLNPENNYILIKDDKPSKIVMLNYKTNKTYGKQTFDITNELCELLEKYIKTFNKQNGDYLFAKPDGESILKNTFLKVIDKSMEEVLGSPLNIDLIRSIIISDYYEKPMSINDKKDLARRFLHSPNVAQEYVKLDLQDD
jgi:hypothetical protein